MLQERRNEPRAVGCDAPVFGGGKPGDRCISIWELAGEVGGQVRQGSRLDDPEILHHNLKLIKSAIVKQRLLEFDYCSPRSPEPKHYIVEPCPGSLECREGHFYFAGQLVKKSRTRDYRVDRIVPGSARLLPQKFVPRERRTRPLVLRYRLKARIARQGATPRFRGHTEEHLPNGDVIITAEITAGELFWASKTLLKYGENCEVLEPPELRWEMARVAREMAQTYRV